MTKIKRTRKEECKSLNVIFKQNKKIVKLLEKQIEKNKKEIRNVYNDNSNVIKLMKDNGCIKYE